MQILKIKMSIFDSPEFYNFFLATTILFILSGLIHHVLTLPPYPPIFGVYHQKSFAFHVKKLLMRILLKFRKAEPIDDADADKLQPLSSDPLVSIENHSVFFYLNVRICTTIRRHLTPFILTRAHRMEKF